MAEIFHLVISVLCACLFILIEQLVESQAQDLEVISTQLPCPEVQHPPDNQRWCYRTTYSSHPLLPIYQCNAVVIDRTNQTVKFVDLLDNSVFTEDGIPQTKLWSPNKIRGRNYQSNRYCLYKAVCPPGHFMYYSWLDGNFELEPEVDGRCLDFVLIQNYDRPSVKLCGSQPRFVDQRSTPLEVTFRSNTPASSRYPGFRIDVLCVSPFFANLPNCTALNRAMVEESNSTNMTEDNDRRSTANATEEANLTLLQDRLKRQTTSYTSLTLSSINIPREVSILYYNNVVKLVAYGKTLRSFRNVNYFFFWTGFNGTRTFRRSAPADVHIYGGGSLRVVKYLAFYSNFRIPPEFEPSRETIGVISMLLNATTPFFLDDDPPDIEPPDIEFSDPSAKKPPIRGTPLPPRSKRTMADVAREQRRKARQTGSIGMDKRIDPKALEMAEMLEDACDVFLREASRSYLRILEEFGIRP